MLCWLHGADFLSPFFFLLFLSFAFLSDFERSKFLSFNSPITNEKAKYMHNQNKALNMHNQQNKTKQNTCTNICKRGGFMQQQHYSLFMYEQAQGFGSNQTCKQQILRTTHMSCLDRALLLAHTKWGHRLGISLH